MAESIELSIEALKTFVEHLHNPKERVSAVLVIKSKNTDKDYTYKITTVTNSLGRITYNIYIEHEYMNFDYVYSIYGDKSPIFKGEGKGEQGAVWLLKKLYRKHIESLLEQVTIFNTGRCIKCNRILTDATSIQYGMGKKCRGGGSIPKLTFNREA